MPIASVLSISQSQDGTLWLGTDGAGLLSYDGYNFSENNTRYFENNHHVSSVIEDKEGLLFTSQYKGLYRYVNNSYQLIAASNNITGDFLKVIKSDSIHLIIASKGIYRVNGSKLIHLHSFKKEGDLLQIHSVITLKNSCIILSSKGNFYFSNEKLKLIPLTSWMNLPSSKTDFISFGIIQGNAILFYDSLMSKELKIILTEKDELFKLDFNIPISTLKQDQQIVSFFFY